MDTDTLGSRIEASRKRCVLTQAELAQAAGVAIVTVNRLENGVIDDPRPDTIRKLARALGVDPAWLLFGEEGKAAA